MKQKVEDPLNALEKDINKLEGNIQRSGKIMSSMQNSVEKLKFEGHKPIPPVKKQEDAALVRRPEMQTSDVDDGCVFSGTASGKSANVKVRTSSICFSLLCYITSTNMTVKITFGLQNGAIHSSGTRGFF